MTEAEVLAAVAPRLGWPVREVVHLSWWRVRVPLGALLPETTWRRVLRWLITAGKLAALGVFAVLQFAVNPFDRVIEGRKRTKVDADAFPARAEWLLIGDEQAAAIVIEDQLVGYGTQRHFVIAWTGPKDLGFPDGSAIVLRGRKT